MTTKTYWENDERWFASEYSIGVATHAKAADDYKSRGYERIPRDLALRWLAYKGDAYVGASIDGNDCYKRDAIRFIRG